MKSINLMMGLSLLLFSALSHAVSAEHVVWDKSPIALNLPLKIERTVLFPRPVKIVANELEGYAVIQKTADTFYIKALKPFEQKSVLLKMMPQGGVIKLSVSAGAQYHDIATLQIALEEERSPNQAIASNGSSINTITLTRFAIQSLFAPARVLEAPDGVNRVPMQTRKTVNLIYGGGVIARPLLSWGGSGLIVTAVQLKNVLSKSQVLDPRNLIGEWEAAAFYPSNVLKPVGNAQDTTTVFVVSHQPFGDALKELRGYVR